MYLIHFNCTLCPFSNILNILWSDRYFGGENCIYKASVDGTDFEFVSLYHLIQNSIAINFMELGYDMKLGWG